MDVIRIIEYLLILLIGIYLIGFLLVWIYEFKKNALYTQMQRQSKFLESLQLSTALGHIKMYRIREDYRRSLEILEGVQQFIFENVLFITRQNVKSGKGFHV